MHDLYSSTLFLYFRYGKWVAEEKAKLLENWEKYQEKYSVDLEDIDPLTLFDRRGKVQIIQIMHETNFYREIAKNLNRSTYACYAKLTRILMARRTKTGEFSQEEAKIVKEMVKKYGRNYQMIGDALGRYKQSVQDFHRRIEKEVQKEHWLKEEEESLINAIKQVTGEESIYKLKRQVIPWREVATLVPTRHEEQCRNHFRRLKMWQLEDLTTPVRWRGQFNVKLLKMIIDADYDFETDIDWFELSESFKDVSPSPSHLQGQFYKLKCTIPEFHRKSYDEIIEALREKYL